MQAKLFTISSLHKPILARRVCKGHSLHHFRCLTRQTALLKQRKRPCVCSACERTVSLPNGLEVCYASQYDVKFLYREILEKKVYLQHGIQLGKGDTVLDIGGNIGFFALFAAQAVGSAGQVITAEPIPELHAKLVYNVEAHTQWCKLHDYSPALITALPVGVGSGQQETMTFTFFPAAAGWSTMYMNDDELERAMEVFLNNALSGLQGIEVTVLSKLGQIMQNSFPAWLSRPIKRLFVRNMLSQKRQHVCRMMTVSEIMSSQRLKKVDLLKIDVERAELDVLLGIKAEDWDMISSVVLEVHEIDDRLQTVTTLLQTKGKFDSIVVEQDEQLRGSTLFNMYCTKSKRTRKT